MESAKLPDLPYMTSCQFNTGKTGKVKSGTSLFKTLLHHYSAPAASDTTTINTSRNIPGQSATLQAARTIRVANREAVSAYQKHSLPERLSDIEKYKDDQLLSNPGGDNYYLNQKKVIKKPDEQQSFWGRIGKNIADSVSNVKNFFGNLLMGSKVHYRDQNNQVQCVKKRGLLGSIVDFVKDAASALSFGKYRPDGEKEPQGIVQRVGFFLTKMKEAVCGDILHGVTSSVIHMGEDLLFAGWNLLETIPDATIGNFKTGRKITTKIFDNGQVILDYLTDILPAGDAWIRVHAADLKKGEIPILHNFNALEYEPADPTRKFVRNTPFRKKIETIGAIAMDILSLKFLRRVWSSDSDRHN